MLGVTKKESRELGLLYYFTGKPCKRGHIDKRFVSNGGCNSCLKEDRRYNYRKNPAINILKTREWEKNNPDKVAATGKKSRIKHKRRNAALFKIWKDNNPDKTRAYEHKRRAIKADTDGEYSAVDILNLLNQQDNKCCGCDIEFNINNKHTIDHIQPLSRGGSNWPYNIQLLCKSCNSSKHTRTMSEWIMYKERVIATDSIST